MHSIDGRSTSNRHEIMGMPDNPSRRVPAWLLLALPLLTSIGCDQAVTPDLEQDAFQRLLSNEPEASPLEAENLVPLWGDACLQAIRDTKHAPPMTGRTLAVVHTAIYDAWAAYDEVALGTRLGGTLRRPAEEQPNRRVSRVSMVGSTSGKATGRDWPWGNRSGSTYGERHCLTSTVPLQVQHP